MRIKTFEEACKILKIDPNNLPDFSMLPEKHRTALLAHTKLVIITQVLNGKWNPDWNNREEYKYYPWWYMEKTDSNPSGFELNIGVLYNYTYSNTNVGSRLCFKSKELADYAATQFIDLYKDYMLIV